MMCGKLQIVFALFATAGYAWAGDCPSNYQQQLLSCSRRMRNLGPNPSCSRVRNAFSCLEPIMSNCQDRPMVAQMSRMINMDSLQSMVDTFCRTGSIEVPSQNANDENCPSNYVDQLTECSRQMRESTSPLNCEPMARSIACLERIFNDCPSQPGIGAASATINFDQFREIISAACPGVTVTEPPVVEVEEPSDQTPTGSLGVPAGPEEVVNEETGEEVEGGVDEGDEEIPESETPTCPHENTSARLQRCNRWLQSVRKQQMPSEVRCRNFRRGLRCFSKLARKCSEDPSVVDFLSRVNLNDVQIVGEYYCPQSSS